MTELHISDSLLLPRDTVTSTLVVYGAKGVGKSNLAMVLAEEFSRLGLRWSYLDPLGVCWGLRHSKDGKAPGIECLILGGAHGDLPIEPTGGTVVADLVADENVNVIIDFSRKTSGEAWGVGEKIRFITDYGRRLFQRQSSLVDGKRREPIFQIVDEAARFIPQIIRAGQPELAMCVSVWAQIVEEARNCGIGVGLFTQRSARLSKDVAELADAMFAFRTVGPNSVAAVMDWLGEHVKKEVIYKHIETVRSLPVGNCLVVSPGWLQEEKVIRIRERKTFDSSATPKPGESMWKVTGHGAKPDLAKYADRMQETIERAKQDDPKELKKQIGVLKQRIMELEKMPKVQDPAAVKRAVEIAIGETVNRFGVALNQAQAALRLHRSNLTSSSAILTDTAKKLLSASESLPDLSDIVARVQGNTPLRCSVSSPNVLGVQARVDRIRKPTSGPMANGVASAGVRLRPGAVRMLAACVQWSPKGMTEGQVAAQSGVKRTSGSFSSYKSNLVTGGYIEIRNRLWYSTELGVEFVGTEVGQSPQTTEEVLAVWRPKLRPGAQRMLDALIAHQGEPLSSDQLGQESGISPDSGSFSSYLSNLATADLIVKPQRGMIAANRETLFL